MTIDVTLGLAILAGLIGAAGWLDSRRKAAMKDGEQKKAIDQLEADLNRAHEKLRSLEERVRTTEGDGREMKADMKHILDSIERMEKKLDRHMEIHAGGEA